MKTKAILLPIVTVAAAALLRWVLTPLLGEQAPLLLFVLPILVSGVWGGPAAALIATALGAIVAESLFAQSRGVVLAAIGLFILEGLVITWLVSRIDAAQRHLVDARDQAEAANRTKDVFIRTLSHELRTPLTVIVGYARMLAAGEAWPEPVRRIAGVVLRNAERQTRLIEDLLDAQQIQAGQFTIRRRPVELAPVVESVLESLEPLAATKKLQARTRLAPATIEADPVRIRQVIWHLASNAIKFAPEGGHYGITVAERDRTVTLRFDNSGAGIPQAFAPHLFKPFQQEDMSTTRSQGGLGLGLWIVKHIVETHGGTVDVESSSTGTVFSVSLPKAQAS